MWKQTRPAAGLEFRTESRAFAGMTVWQSRARSAHKKALDPGSPLRGVRDDVLAKPRAKRAGQNVT